MPRFGTDPFFTGQDDSTLIDVPLNTAIGAAARRQFADNPTNIAADASRVSAETTGREQSDSSRVRFGNLPNIRVVKSETISATDAKARIDSEGLAGHLTVPKTGIPIKALDTLIELKNAELRNNFLVDRYHGGVAGGGALMATQLAVALTDPLNIASGFVPVVGEARYARLLQTAGASLLRRGAVRTGVGALEGSVGQALLEPLYQTSKFQLQQDYTVDDSLRNIAFGGLFGGTLHVGAGGFSDLLAKTAGVGAWAETITPDGTRHLPDLPEGAIGGGGTTFVHGDDYVRGQYAVIDASTARAGGAPFERLDPVQVGDSPYAGAGAPVLRPDGSVVDGSKRLATVAEAYKSGAGDGYRADLIENAEKYGLDSTQVNAMGQPVLVRVESSREVGAWGERVKSQERPAEPLMETVPAGVTAAEHARNVVSDLQTASAGRLFDREVKAAKAELQSLYVTLSEKPPRVVREAAQARIEQLQTQLDKHGLAMEAQTALAELPDFVRQLAAQVTPEQAATALRMGVAQAVNDLPVEMAAVRHLDGTNEGVAAFLAERQAMDLAAARQVAEQQSQIERVVSHPDNIDPEDAAALAIHVKQLEADLRAELKAGGHDPAEVDALLAESDELAKELKVETKAYNGIAMCLMRSA